MKPVNATKAPVTFFALAFGLFLGLCLWKFGNPVILENKIETPANADEFWTYAWPPHWANWILLALSVLGGGLILKKKILWAESKWLWLLPLAWLSWQFIAATQTVDANLTRSTLWQFSGCVACYFLGAWLLNNRRTLKLLFIGLFIAFTFCLLRAINQHCFEFPANHQLLVEGERSGWTNFPPETIAAMKHDTIILTTNGVDVANPLILEKFRKGRAAGTMVYPNALAGLILLLLPVALVFTFEASRHLKPLIRLATIALAVFLGGAAFFWSGSKLGWLIGIVIAGIFLLRLDWPRKLKVAGVALVVIGGLGIFAVRFQHYFAKGATSASARLDYWQAAAQTTAAKPFFGTGPGTFQRPYAQLKAPESEMARLTHNDYLEQFSDSGIPGGLTYASWILMGVLAMATKFWKQKDMMPFAIFAGLLAWLAQGLGEFGLYIPALAWTAFTLFGGLIGWEIIEFDKKSADR
jgi:hypothetical protein